MAQQAHQADESRDASRGAALDRLHRKAHRYDRAWVTPVHLLLLDLTTGRDVRPVAYVRLRLEMRAAIYSHVQADLRSLLQNDLLPLTESSLRSCVIRTQKRDADECVMANVDEAGVAEFDRNEWFEKIGIDWNDLAKQPKHSITKDTRTEGIAEDLCRSGRPETRDFQ